MSENKILELEKRLREKRISKKDYTEISGKKPQNEIKSSENVTNVTPIKKENLTNSTLKKKGVFRFDNLIDEISDTIYNHTTASYLQIHMKVLQNLAFAFSYGGIHKFVNLGLYVYDFSPTGTAKSEVIKKSNRLILLPIIKQVEKLHQEASERAKEEKKDTPLFRAVNPITTSPEALFEAFEHIPVQMIETGELGRVLKANPDIITYIIDLYGQRYIQVPSYKNKKEITKHIIENINFFFYGATTIQYLGPKAFYEHLNGGLINRGIIVFNPKLREFEELPKSYELDQTDIRKYNAIVKDILEFANISDFQLSNSFRDNPFYKAFHKDIYEKQKELTQINNPFANLYVRLMQNFDIVLLTLSLLEWYEKGYYENKINDKTIEKAIEFFKIINDNNEELIEHLLNYKEEQNEELTHKVIAKAKEIISQKGYCTLRDIYKPLKISSNKALFLLENYNRENGEFIIETKGNSTRITFIN